VVGGVEQVGTCRFDASHPVGRGLVFAEPVVMWWIFVGLHL